LPELPISPEWTPRNFDFYNVATADVMDRIAAELYLVVGWNWQAGKLNWNLPGQSNAANIAIFDKIRQSAPLMGGGPFERDPSRAPGSIKVTFPVINSDTSDPYSLDLYSHTVATGGSGRQTQSLQIGNQPAFNQSSTIQNSSDLTAIATDIAGRAYAFMTQSEGAYTFSGIQPFQPDGSIREIVWQSSHGGPTTKIFGHNGRDYKQLGDEWRTMEFPSNELVAGMGSTQVSFSPAGTRYTWNANTPPAVVKIINNLSGAGKYNGTIYNIPTTDDGTGDLTLPDGMTAGASCLVINTEEPYNILNTAGGTHRLFLNSYAVGTYGGMSQETPPRPTIIVRGGFYRIDSPTNLPVGTYGAPNGTSWCKQSGATANGTPVQTAQMMTVFNFDSGSGNIWYHYRTLLFDAGGKIYSISAETEVLISTSSCSGTPGTVTNVSIEIAGPGMSGSVINSTTTPNISIGLASEVYSSAFLNGATMMGGM
jgi:hypothetical protein